MVTLGTSKLKTMLKILQMGYCFCSALAARRSLRRKSLTVSIRTRHQEVRTPTEFRTEPYRFCLPATHRTVLAIRSKALCSPLGHSFPKLTKGLDCCCG